MNNKRLGNREIVLGMKSKCANDKKVVKKDEKLLEGVANDSNLENETNELSQTPSQHDNEQSRRKDSMDNRDIVLGLKSNDYETKELSQTPSHRKQSRRKEITITSSLRILRSRSQEKPKVVELFDVPSQENREKRKKRKKAQKVHHNNEFSKIKTHIKYLLNRMKYEQTFIEAYAGEGWKGQSLEKLRPEKELERAKSDINRYKLKIRDLFKRIDTSCEEGRIPESLYDSEGEIDSEDIFCAKCGQTDVWLDNDIILCDGACERGFHQYCLDPPLLKEQVPPGDEGWLCPACDCKVDCVDFLNDYLGTDLSIEDSWEKVFPETAALGNKLDDNLGLPSDDSEDDDYNPDGAQVEEDGCNSDGPQVEEDEVDAEDSSSDESDFSSASEDLTEFAKSDEVLGLPSDDSEDDDFSPDRLESDEDAKKEGSSSDFSSDSEDLDDMKNDVTLNEVQEKEELIEGKTENDDFGPITAKRNVERLDYKRLHDEAYGNASSDSSDEDFSDSGDEDFFDSEAPSKRKNTKGAKDIKVIKKQKQSESTPVNKRLTAEDTSDSPAHNGFSDNNGNRSSSSKRYGEAVTQRLNEAFNENHYLNRGVREILVKELNLTHSQVNKWFEKARWRLNHPEGRGKSVKSSLKPAEKLVTEQTNELLGLHSDDSDDDDGDFNPDKLDSDEEVKNKGSGSDFTFDSEDLDDIKNEVIPDEVQEKQELTDGNTDNDDFGPITAKRKVQRLDYKKLHDEAYGNDSSDSSDEDFIDSEVPSAQKNTHGAKDTKNNKKQKQNEITPVSKKLIDEDTSHINGSRPSSYNRLGEAVIQRLNEAFKENRYPDRNARENLVKELNLTHSQVCKWFGNARWKFNHTEGHSKLVKSSAAKVAGKQANEVISTTPKSRKRKTNADSSDQPTRRSGRVQAKSS
ncbi:homeobox protein HOX1A-like [Bidens hawaiensis]|uniref:homeobox protein HOX1A-like n=1 Tax=Bidens hawaiensis TaxID=980011 RepID=UPI0040494F41